MIFDEYENNSVLTILPEFPNETNIDLSFIFFISFPNKMYIKLYKGSKDIFILVINILDTKISLFNTLEPSFIIPKNLNFF